MKMKNLLKIVGVIALVTVIGFSMAFSGCFGAPSEYECEFVNQTPWTVYVTLNKKYHTKYKDSNGNMKNNDDTSEELRLSSNTAQKIYVGENPVDFQWTANSDNNLKIYTENSGSKITFKERQK